MKTLPFEFCDAGRTVSGPDCVCRAFALLTRGNYAEIEKWLIDKYGYTPRKKTSGISISEIMFREGSEIFGTKFKQVFHKSPKFKGLSLARFVSENPKGDFLMHVSCHVFVLSNGVILDTWKQADGRHLKNVWEVIK